MPTREVRLGIVLYGGVSLAIYENGVTQELYRAIRGDGMYGLIQELIDSRLVVDIISGTSAGGVNGIMLGFALANQRQFAPSADLWRNQGDINALLRSETDSATSSILNSSYYQEKLQECFAESLIRDPNQSAIDELDLFITGTDANGEKYTIYDDQGHALDVKNHRALFKLKYRKEGRVNDFADASPADLAKLARLTSCFPVAFEPVPIKSSDTNFFKWGKLKGPAVYLDGGILNNKPFTSTIDAIFRRTATCDVERFLIYVEPDPEVFAPSATSGDPHSPTIAQAGFSALVSIPGYQSIASDLQAIEEHNEVAGRIRQILDKLPPAPATDAECLEKAGLLFDNQPGCDDTAYFAARLIQLRDTAVSGMLNDKNGRSYIDSPEDRRSGRILVESFDRWPGDAVATLEKFDVFFRMRRANHLSNHLMRRAKLGQSAPETVWSSINHFIKLYEIVEWAMLDWLNRWDFSWRSLGPRYPQLDTLPPEEQERILAEISVEVWGEADRRLSSLLWSDVMVPEVPSPAGRSALYKTLKSWMTSPAPAGSPSSGNLLDTLDRVFRTTLKNLGDEEVAATLRNEFCRFIEIDRQIFPIQVGSGYRSTDAVRVVRFSPLDAQRGLSQGKVSEKVCGLALGAFGGFFKKSWRANDIMVGRLDAACLLAECLLTKERLAALPAGRTVTVDRVSQCFPNLGAKAPAMAASINTYLANPRAATKETWSALMEEIVGAAHNEIQLVEWPKVVRSAIEQEYAWGRYETNSVPPGDVFDRKNLVWNRARRKPDQILAAVAANAIAAGQLPAFTPGAVAGRGFIDEIPDTVLQELGFLSAIRFNKGLIGSIENPDIRARIEKLRAYRLPFVSILPLLYRWARMRRTQPDSVIVFNTAIPIACLSVLTLALLLRVFDAQLSWQLWTGIIAIPLFVGAVWAFFFRK